MYEEFLPDPVQLLSARSSPVVVTPAVMNFRAEWSHYSLTEIVSTMRIR